MKKLLVIMLTLGLVGLAGAAFAQTVVPDGSAATGAASTGGC